MSDAHTAVCTLSLVRTPTRQQLPPGRAALRTAFWGQSPPRLWGEGLERKGLGGSLPLCLAMWVSRDVTGERASPRAGVYRPVSGSDHSPWTERWALLSPNLDAPGSRGLQSRLLMAPADLGSRPVRAGPGIRAVSQARPMPPRGLRTVGCRWRTCACATDPRGGGGM